MERTPEEIAVSLETSRSDRETMRKRFGFIPLSVLRIGRRPLSRYLFTYQKEEPSRRGATQANLEKKIGKERATARQTRMRAAGMTSTTDERTWRFRGIAKGASNASIMPAEIVDFFVDYYAEPGQTYLDPFMGQGIQLQVAARRGLNYRGYDLSEEFCRYIRGFLPKVKSAFGEGLVLEATLGDSRHPDGVPDGCGDFCFTSPPYWDVEFYGDEPGQLGRGTYEHFLSGMEEVARAWLPKFRPGAIVVVNVNDFRRGGVWYSYHSDTIDLFRRAGYTYSDVWIFDGLIAGFAKVFSVMRNKKRQAPKIHEYALVFEVPG